LYSPGDHTGYIENAFILRRDSPLGDPPSSVSCAPNPDRYFSRSPPRSILRVPINIAAESKTIPKNVKASTAGMKDADIIHVRRQIVSIKLVNSNASGRITIPPLLILPGSFLQPVAIIITGNVIGW
jgi:hypothetical protein